MLTRLFSRIRNAFGTPITPPPISQAVLKDLEKLDTFPTLSDTAVRAMALANDPSATLADLAAVIRRDSLVAAAVLKMANSWMYRGKQTTDNVQQAVVRLGMKECARLVTAVGMRGLYAKGDRRVTEGCDTLLRHSFFVATLASAINKRFKLGFAGEEFTAGLLHDIGRVILCVKAIDAFSRVDPLDFEDELLLEREQRFFQTDHQSIGALFAVKNDLPTQLGRVIVNHHRPSQEKEYKNLVALVSAADDLANHTHRNHSVADYQMASSSGFEILMSKWDSSRRQEMLESLPSIVVRAMRECRSILRAAGD